MKKIYAFLILFFLIQQNSYASRIWIRPKIYIRTTNQKVIKSCLSYASSQCDTFSFWGTGLTGVGCFFKIFLLDKRVSTFFEKNISKKKIESYLRFQSLKYTLKYVKVYTKNTPRSSDGIRTYSRPLYRFSEEIPYIEDVIICTSPTLKIKKEEELARIIKMFSSKENLVRWEALQLVYRFSHASPALLSTLQKIKKHEKLDPFKAYAAFLSKRTKYHLQTKQDRWKNVQSLLHHPNPWNRWEGMQRLLIDPSFSRKRVIHALQMFHKKESKRYKYFQKEAYRDYPFKSENSLSYKRSLFYRRLRSRSREILNFSSGYLHRLTGNPVKVH